MEVQELEITIDPDGTTRILVRGAKGSECLELTEKLEQMIGEVEERTFTAEYYEQQTTISSERKMKRE
jgi:hypothetical protein